MALLTNKKEKEQSQREKKEELKIELLQICNHIKKLEQQFNMTENEDLLEALIYEQKALQSRYTYLVKKARENEIEINFIERN